MPQAARHRDLDTGHGCWPPRPNAVASPDVYTNSRGQHRQTDDWEVHCCGPACHGSVTTQGSSTVFVNGLPAARIGDQVACGSVIMTGSTNVFIGG